LKTTEAHSQLHVHEDDLELYVRGRLKLERISPLESHLAECQMCQELLSACVGQRLAFQPTPGTTSEAAQKRTEPRFSTEGEGSLQELHPLSLDRQKINIVNVSKNGLGLLSPKAIYPGTIVQLRIKDIVELGNVRYCFASGDGFQIGLRLHGEG
jgi:hypothetical protein